MDLNLGTFLFLFLRIAPFILVCFFTLSSIFNSDLRGIAYLFGLLWAIFVSFLVGNNISFNDVNPDDKSAVCDFVLFGGGQNANIPVGETVLGFTFFYLFTTLILKDQHYISKNMNFENMPNIPSLSSCLVTPWQMLSLDFLNFIPRAISNIPNIKENFPTILFFVILIAFDIFWNTNIFGWLKQILGLPANYCYTISQSGTAYAIGILIGILWSNIIYKMKSPELQYFPEYKNNEVCKKASPTKYKCKVYKNGKLIQDK
jgi:hypothetical protein